MHTQMRLLIKTEENRLFYDDLGFFLISEKLFLYSFWMWIHSSFTLCLSHLRRFNVPYFNQLKGTSTSQILFEDGPLNSGPSSVKPWHWHDSDRIACMCVCVAVVAVVGHWYECIRQSSNAESPLNNLPTENIKPVWSSCQKLISNNEWENS